MTNENVAKEWENLQPYLDNVSNIVDMLQEQDPPLEVEHARFLGLMLHSTYRVSIGDSDYFQVFKKEYKYRVKLLHLARKDIANLIASEFGVLIRTNSLKNYYHDLLAFFQNLVTRSSYWKNRKSHPEKEVEEVSNES